MLKINNKDFENKLYELGQLKNVNGNTWNDIATTLRFNFINEPFVNSITEDYCRKRFNLILRDRLNKDEISNQLDILNSIKKERVKLSDEVVQNNAYVRQLAREETIKEIAREYAEVMYKGKILETPFYEDRPYSFNQAILQISDWHYGIEFENYWNSYNPEICIQRVNELQEKVIKLCKINSITKLHVVNLSDLISGYIHLTLRLQNRYDVITQVMDVAEILAEFLNNLSKYVDIEYYDCLDNHSRLDPNKKDSINLESLVRIIHWYLVERFKNCSKININNSDKYSGDIIEFSCNGYSIAGVHGDNDNINNVVERLSLLTDKTYDIILTAHNHHFAANEENMCAVIQNGSLMGTDYYSTKLRKKAKASQNFIVLHCNDSTQSINRIILN